MRFVVALVRRDARKDFLGGSLLGLELREQEIAKKFGLIWLHHGRTPPVQQKQYNQTGFVKDENSFWRISVLCLAPA
jgi:hypothetical protein